MKIIFTLLGFSLLLASCTRVEYNKVREERKDSSIVIKGALIIGDPIDFYNDKLLVFPIGGLHAEAHPLIDEKERAVFFRSGSVVNAFDNSIMTEYRINDEKSQQVNNLIFYNKATREKRLLVDSGLHILSFAVHKEFRDHLIFYEIVKTDKNNDSLYTSEDAVLLYISNTDGTAFIQLSPDNEKYLTYFYYPETNTILVKSVADTNNDGKFSFGEETRFTEVNVNSPGAGKDIFSEDLKKQLRSFVQ